MAIDFNSNVENGGFSLTAPDDDEIFHDYAAASDLTEVARDDFPSYFEERDGRLFHSHGGSPYPLPVDTPEQNVTCASL
jgi:hypothetical protein